MTEEFKREERYIVFKVSDLGNSLKGDEIRRLAREYAEHRRSRGKKPLECVVVEKDWPEYEPTWKAIEARITGAQPASSVPIAAIGKILNEVIEIAVSNGANSIGMPDEYVEVAAWLCEVSQQPAPSVPDGWLRAIDDALVSAHVGIRYADDSYEQAKAKLDSLIGFHVDVASDPAVNGGWKLVPEKHPTFDPVDLQFSDGSILCGCVPQADGDYWWEGPSGEVFIDPKYSNVTHWRPAADQEVKP